MLGYSLELAWRGLRRYPRITLLSVLALALGIGATVTAHTVTRLLEGDPVPTRSGQLYAVELSRPLTAQTADQPKTRPSDKLTWLDVRQLEAARPDVAQTAVVNTTGLTIKNPSDAKVRSVEDVAGLEVQPAFFQMFDVPLLEGHAWTRDDDANAAPVAVISSSLASKVFGTADAIGKTIHVNDKLFRVVGVSGPWHPYPHFYGLDDCTYACDAEQVFIPVSAARAQGVGKYSLGIGGVCDSSHGAVDAAKCPYLGFWALLPDEAKRAAYRGMLAHYADMQKTAGRLAQGGMAATGLPDVSTYLDAHHIVPLSARFGVWVAVVFLLVCLTNVAGLLLTRFLRSSSELGIRRALGAARRAIFAQCLIEAALVGLVGGLLALPLVWGGLWLVKQQPVAYASVIGLDESACVALLVLAVLSSAVIGIVPAWRASVVEPGLQVKEQ